MENVLTFCAVCVHTDVGKDVFLFDSRSFGFAQVGVTFACDLILHGEMHHCRAGACFSTFLAQMTPHSQKRNILMLSLSLSASLSLPLSLYRSHTDNMCTQTASPHWMTVWMYLINQWVTLLLCYYDDFSLLCITSCNRGFCSVIFTTINTLRVQSFRLRGGLSVNLARKTFRQSSKSLFILLIFFAFTGKICF